MTDASAPYAALTIAGSDSSGGAGIQADLKAFAAFGVHGASVITAVTAQNTVSVEDIHLLPLSSIEAQLDAVFSDLPIRAVKIGMIGSASIASLVRRFLEQADDLIVVVDTPLMSGTGAALGGELVWAALVEHLFPLADVITPNLHEAALLLDQAPLNYQLYSSDDKVIEQFKTQASHLLGLGSRSVLLKGGHFYDAQLDNEKKHSELKEKFRSNKKAIDVFAHANGTDVFVSDWVDVVHHHGTGCALASALAANLIYGKDAGKSEQWAVVNARNWLNERLQASQHMLLGKGPGPLNIANLRQIDL